MPQTFIQTTFSIPPFANTFSALAYIILNMYPKKNNQFSKTMTISLKTTTFKEGTKWFENSPFL